MTLTAPLDQELHLAEKIRRGDVRAFASVYTAYYKVLCGFTNSFVHSSEIAEELVQDVFCRIWDRRQAFLPTGSLRGYLFGAARNRALGFLRHERVGDRLLREAEVGGEAGRTLGARPAGPDEELQENELQAALDAAVNRLTEGQRTVITLRWHYQLTSPEIAQILGITVKGVEAQAARAVKSVRARLARFRE